MLSATLQLCVRILPAKGIPTRGVGRNSLISSFPDDRIARKPERNRNFTRDRSRSFNLAQAFFLFPSFFFFSSSANYSSFSSPIDILKTLWKSSCLRLLQTFLFDSFFETTINILLFYIAISLFDHSDYSRGEGKEIFPQFHSLDAPGQINKRNPRSTRVNKFYQRNFLRVYK